MQNFEEKKCVCVCVCFFVFFFWGGGGPHIKAESGMHSCARAQHFFLPNIISTCWEGAKIPGCTVSGVHPAGARSKSLILDTDFR